MEQHSKIRVQLDSGQALVTTASGRFHVSQKDKADAVSSCPIHLMLGALGSCIMLTLNAVAKHKGIALGETDIHLDYYKAKNGSTRFMVAMQLDDQLTEREKRILYQSARICEVGKILKSDVCIDYQLMNNESVN